MFLTMLFITGSNKIIFLTLWIASLFGIAAYLIIGILEYRRIGKIPMETALKNAE